MKRFSQEPGVDAGPHLARSADTLPEAPWSSTSALEPTRAGRLARPRMQVGIERRWIVSSRPGEIPGSPDEPRPWAPRERAAIAGVAGPRSDSIRSDAKSPSASRGGRMPHGTPRTTPSTTLASIFVVG